jgi:hypothetical protein
MSNNSTKCQKKNSQNGIKLIFDYGAMDHMTENQNVLKKIALSIMSNILWLLIMKRLKSKVGI